MRKILSNIIRSIADAVSGDTKVTISNGRRTENIQVSTNSRVGKNIVIVNGKVVSEEDKTWIDDELISGDIHIEIHGDVRNLDTKLGSITVNGNANGNVHTSQGSIRVTGSVGGDVKTSMGSIDIGGSVEGSATTSMGRLEIHNKRKK